jgi:hypothetical protein
LRGDSNGSTLPLQVLLWTWQSEQLFSIS